MEKLEAMKQKLSFKKRLAAGCAVLGLPVSAIVSKLVQSPVLELLKQFNLIKYKQLLADDELYMIASMEQIYINKYPVKIPYSDAETYLANIRANKANFGADYEMVYHAYERAFNLVKEDIMYLNDTVGQSQAIGFGAGVLSFLLIAGIPTTRYLMCKKKIKSLEKQNKNNLEIENNLGK